MLGAKHLVLGIARPSSAVICAGATSQAQPLAELDTGSAKQGAKELGEGQMSHFYLTMNAGRQWQCNATSWQILVLFLMRQKYLETWLLIVSTESSFTQFHAITADELLPTSLHALTDET